MIYEYFTFNVAIIRSGHHKMEIEVESLYLEKELIIVKKIKLIMIIN